MYLLLVLFYGVVGFLVCRVGCSVVVVVVLVVFFWFVVVFG